MRDSTAFLKWSVADIKRNHYDLAMSRMKSGDYSAAVLADLDFILHRWPNHYPALQALFEYERGGGKLSQGKSVVCYLAAARYFAPDDASLPLLQGNYHYAQKRYGQAEAAWNESLSLNGSSAEAHYNLGLLYVKQGDYTKAMKHAVHAYDAGFPLSGLRDELKRVGKWNIK